MEKTQPSLLQSLLSRPRPFWRPETGIFLFLWFYLLGFGRSRLLQDPGTFWHTVIGQQIDSDLGWPLLVLYVLLLLFFAAGLVAWLRAGSADPEQDRESYGLRALVDGVVLVLLLLCLGTVLIFFGSRKLIFSDTFSFTFAGRPWIPHQWLGECLMALVHQLDGLDSLLLATVTILACLYTWVAHRLIRAGLHWTLTILVVFLVVAASASHFHVRPHLATIVFLALTMGLLVDFEAGRIGPARLAWLVPIYLLWTNMHGGTLGGLATFALALAGWSLYALFGQPSPIASWRRFAAVTLLLAACALTVLVNPYGTRLVRTWLDIVGSDVLPRIIVEHRPLSVTQLDGWLVLLLGGGYLALLLSRAPPAGLARRWPRISWLLPIAWFVQAALHIRHAPLLAVTAALALADLLPYTRFAAWANRTGSDLFREPTTSDPTVSPGAQEGRVRGRWRPALLPALLLVTAVVLQGARIEAPLIGHGWARLDPSYWPVELLPELKAHQDNQPGGTPIFNDYLFGGFLIYHLPGYRVFVDDRCELYRDPRDRYRDQWLDDFVNPVKWPNELLPVPDAEAAQRHHAAGVNYYRAGQYALAVRQLQEAYRNLGNSTDAMLIMKIVDDLDLFARTEKIHEWERRYGLFPFALVQTDAGYDAYFRNAPEWEVVKRTPTATLYRRRSPLWDARLFPDGRAAALQLERIELGEQVILGEARQRQREAGANAAE